MNAGIITIIIATMTYFVMVAAYFLPKNRNIHIPIMVGVMLFDLLIPVYLLLNRDWYRRLIEHGDILTFGVWMHFMVVLVLYILYVFQITAGLKMLKGEEMETARADHRAQAKGILLVRGFVIFTGALMYDSDYLLK
ncbi:MAG: Uncharacterized protein FD130_798 [Halothiobacillaceae bacterium]|nr:MAG: Uncharacterized protein FD130_798 [Halothiobacillaceae bacterium]